MSIHATSRFALFSLMLSNRFILRNVWQRFLNTWTIDTMSYIAPTNDFGHIIARSKFISHYITYYFEYRPVEPSCSIHNFNCKYVYKTTTLIFCHQHVEERILMHMYWHAFSYFIVIFNQLFFLKIQSKIVHGGTGHR